MREPVSRSTLADASANRDWRIYAEFANRLIDQARKLYANEDLGLDMTNTVYALDSTTIDLFSKRTKQREPRREFYRARDRERRTQKPALFGG